MNDSKTFPSTSDLSATASETDLNTAAGRRAFRVASLAADLIRTYEHLQSQGYNAFDAGPLDVLTDQHYRLINDGYIGLATFKGFVDYLCERYDDVQSPDGLNQSVAFLLNWLNVYDREKGGRV